MITIVAGPPAAGKTTWVQHRAKPGDLVIDLDAIAGVHDRTPAQTTAALAEMQRMEIGALGHPGDVWVIRCAPDLAHRRALADRLGADRTVVLATPAAMAKRRAAQAGRPSIWPRLIDEWWQAYESDPTDEVEVPRRAATAGHERTENAAMAEPTPETPTPEADPNQPEPEGNSLPAAAEDEAEKWKKLSRKNENEAKRLRSELEKAQQASMSEQEKAVAQAKAAGYTEGLSAATERLRRAEVRAEASGVLADPNDAVLHLDLTNYLPNDDGEFDRKAIRSDIAALVKVKPYLGATPGNGSGEGGPRGVPTPPALNGDPLQRALEAKLGIK